MDDKSKPADMSFVHALEEITGQHGYRWKTPQEVFDAQQQALELAAEIAKPRYELQRFHKTGTQTIEAWDDLSCATNAYSFLMDAITKAKQASPEQATQATYAIWDRDNEAYLVGR
jgi:hypothetical protein